MSMNKACKLKEKYYSAPKNKSLMEMMSEERFECDN